MKSKGADLLNDSIGKLLLKLSLPAILAQLVNALYNIVDRIYIGRIAEIGKDALTGVGVAFPIIMLISAFAALIGMGGAPRAAIKLGENDKDAAERILGNCFIMLIGVSVVLTAVFLIFGERLLLMFGASENTIEYATSYMQIYVCGTIFVQLSLGLNSFISAQGYASTAMKTVLIGAGINIVLDPILIFGFNMGVRGAAVATIAAQAVSAIWVVRFLRTKKSHIRIRKRHFRISAAVILPVLALGLSPFIMQSTESLVNIVLNSSLKKHGGDSAVGAMTIISSIMQFCMLPLMGLTSGAQPIISYNYGAKQIGRVKKAFKYTFISAVSFSIIIWSALMLFPQIFVRLFSNDQELMRITVWAMKIFFFGVFAMGVQNSCQQTFVALGQSKVSLFLALLRKVVLLIPLVYILPLFLSNNVQAVFLAEPIADILAASTTLCVFLSKFNRILKERENEPIPTVQPEKLTQSVE